MNKIKIRSFKLLFYCILALAVCLRLFLAITNDGSANDDHYTVSTLILEKGSIPEPQDCWQCYQPKLYHYGLAKLWSFFKIDDEMDRKKLAQLINALAGILTVLICWLNLKRYAFSEPIKLICFSLIALNPGLIAMSAQPTNDSLIILFGSIVIHWLQKLLAEPGAKNFLVVLIFSVLAGLTKANSIIIVAGVIIVLIIKSGVSKNYQFSLNKGYLGGLLIYLMVTIPSIGYFAEYYSNYKKYDELIVHNQGMGEAPYFFEKTNCRRPGVQSVFSGYFTFRYFDMIRNPVITNDEHTYPLHRTSVWSQLYGRAHFIYFDYWPPRWQCNDPAMMKVGSVALTVALLPSLFLIVGWLSRIKKWLWWLSGKASDLFKSDDWMNDVFTAGFMAFIIHYSAMGRDFSYIKTLFLFPGIVAVLLPLLKGCEYFYNHVHKNRILSAAFYSVIVVLLVSYIIPVVDLIKRLYLIM